MKLAKAEYLSDGNLQVLNKAIADYDVWWYFAEFTDLSIFANLDLNPYQSLLQHGHV